VRRFVPEAAIHYRQGMRKVDTHDFLLSIFKIGRIGKKWWHPLFYHLLECCIVNSWNLFKKHKKVDVSQKEFRLALAAQLKKNFTARERMRSPNSKASYSSSSSSPSSSLLHFPQKTEKRMKCQCDKLCTAKTFFTCSNCKIYILPDHFEKAHKQ